MRLYRILFILCLFLVDFLWASTFPVRLLSERHRTEWNWVEYRLTLKNLTDSTLRNPVIRYFAENPKIQYCRANPNDSSCSGMSYGIYDVDSTLRAEIDDWTKVDSVRPKYYYDSEYSVISFQFYGNIPAHSKSVIHLRIMRHNYPAWNCMYDYSFQKNATVQEEHYKMAVYDGDGNILWGNDPVAVKRDTVNVYWYDRSSVSVILPYEAKDSSKTLKGRFWLLKEKSLTDGERTSLTQIGANLLETTRYQGRGLHLLKSALPIKKKTLDSALSEFYNAFVADDTTKIPLTLYPDDIYEQTQTCNTSDSCTTVVNTRSAIDMVVECWPDLPMSRCKQIVMQCSGDTAYIDRRIILAKVRRDSLQCLEKHRDVRGVRVLRKGVADNDKGRKAVKLTELQGVDFKWKQALQAVEVTTDWLSNADYTGEGVAVGVYDNGFDFSHPGLMEKDANGEYKTRKAYDEDDPWNSVEKDTVEKHGTHVAGIIGGNGRMSETVVGAKPYQFRGVAPKVKFYFGDSEKHYHHQRGDVVNHSHFVSEGVYLDPDRYDLQVNIGKAYYGNEHSNLDRDIFTDWKEITDMGDYRSKTVVLTAGNNGDKARHSTPVGYYSITNDSKNAIVVGNFDPETMTLSEGSSLGPTWDGRIKPDIMAPGTNIMSSVPIGLMGVYYSLLSGTSMAAPFVSGIAALMYQKFQKQTGLPLESFSLRNSTTKALLIHSAIDMQGCSNRNVDIANLKNQPKTCTPYTRGPDFATGWGRVNAKGALALIDKYDVNTGMFANFREFTAYEGVEKQKSWNIFVREGRLNLRTSLVWDDVPGDPVQANFTNLKLVNDLDMYLISPSGKVFYPWRLNKLPIINLYGQLILSPLDKWQKITFDDANAPAYRDCKGEESTALVDDECFDRMNNVEVVDVENPEPGLWQVVAKGFKVETGNSLDGKAQIASIVSDFELMDKMYNDEHPYAANAKMWEIRDLGEGFLEHYVTFSPETSLGAGDHIYLYDEWDNLIGDYMGNSLANQRVIVKTRFLKIILFSNNDNSQGWGYSISKIEHVPYGVLQVLFPPYKKGE